MRHLVRISICTIAIFVVATAALAQGGVIKPGDSVQGTLNNSENTYTISATASSLIIVSVESDAFDTLISVAGGGGEWTDDDGGEGTNSRLSFVAPADGDYTLTVGGFGGFATGVYTLNVTAGELQPLAYGQPANINLSGADARFFSFEGAQGDVVNITADSAGELDTNLTLSSPTGEELVFDEDGGPSIDPAIVRAILPEDGVYLVTLAPFADRELIGPTIVQVDTAELLSLDDGALTVSLGSEFDYDILRYTVELGQTYLVTIEATGPSASVRLEINSEDGFPYAGIDLDNVVSGSFAFVAETSGQTDIEIREGFFTSSNEVIVTIKPAQ